MIEERLNDCLKEGGRYLLAVSGGADSICLLHAAHSVASKKTCTLHVAHINHNLRTDSAKDAEFVSLTCEELSIPFHLHVAKDPPSSNIEAWGRSERYRFFETVLKENSLDGILTAHTANDVVETFLMRTLANKEPRNISEREDERRLIRPFLRIWRKEIAAYLSSREISYREDESNSDTRFLRNKVRNLVIPFLDSNFDGDTRRILFDRAIAADKDMKLLDSFAVKVLHELDKYTFGSKEWLRSLKSNIEEMDEGIAWRLIESLFRPIIGYGLGREWGARLCEFFRRNAPRIELPSKWVVVRKDSGIAVSRYEL